MEFELGNRPIVLCSVLVGIFWLLVLQCLYEKSDFEVTQDEKCYPLEVYKDK